MNEFNVLLGAATNGTPSGSLFDALFARYIAPQESWRELESPLPITILATGKDLIDYRIYGNTVQTGTPTPENPIMPSGCGERTENLYDKDAKDTANGYEAGRYININGVTVIDSKWDVTEYIPCFQQTIYCFSNCVGAAASICWYDSNKNFIGGSTVSSLSGFKTMILTSPTNAFYVRTCVLLEHSGTGSQQYDRNVEVFMITRGLTAPAQYIPYGYKLPMVVTNGATTTTTPIYIGSDPLAEDEYVSYSEQKIYRMEGGTLTPTDPPVPLPALPTIRGETIIDYNPSETPAVEPEKMYVKYKPQ